MEKRRSYEGLLFFAPYAVGFAAFFAYPLVTSIRYVFSTMPFRGMLKEMTFAGWDNFYHIFTEDIHFPDYFLRTIQDTLLHTPFIVIFSMIIAIIINKRILFRSLFRSIFFLPFLLGTGFVMQLLLGIGSNPGETSFFRGLTLAPSLQHMLGDLLSGTIGGVLRELVVMLWRMGLQTLLFLSALQGISSSLYESAKVDGATEWEMFWKITLPMLSPMVLVCIVYTIVDSFTDITNPMLAYILDLSTRQMLYTYTTTMAWVYMLFVLTLLIVVMTLFNAFFIVKLDRPRARRF